MPDEIAGTEDASIEIAEPTGPAENQSEAPSSGGGNPHWEKVRSQLDPISYRSIEPFLKEADKNAETRISSVNSQLSAYSEFGSPDEIRNYAMLAKRIDSEPEVIYQALGAFLQANGRMPETQREVQEAVDAVEEENDAEPVADPRLDRIEQFLAQQEKVRIEQEAEASLDAEIKQVRSAHPELDEADMQAVMNLAVAKSVSTRRDVSLAAVAEDYLTNVVNRIRSAPRAGDSAPRTLPTSGGSASSASQVPLGKMSRSQTQDLMASLLSQSKGS